MILFNTTFILESTSDPGPFLGWASERYIPAALASPGIGGHTLALIATPPEEGTRSYALQLVMADEAAVALWDDTAAALRSELERAYGSGRVVWFSTYMEIVSLSFPSLSN